MYKDYTLKAKISSGKEVEKKLAQLNSRFVGIDLQTDTYFQVENGKLKLREGTIENLITHYERTHQGEAEKTRVYRYDVNPTPAEIQKLRSTHQQIGIIEKERKIYFIDHIKVHLDKLPNGEEFLELEAIDTQNRFSDDELKRHCLDIKEKLGIQEKDILQTGYLTHST
jgi:adenylate cyclase, class 2